MKFFSLIIILVLLVAALASCDKSKPTSPYSEDNYNALYPQSSYENTESNVGSVTPLSDGQHCEYDTFYEFVANESSEYTFTIVEDSVNSVDKLKWYVYILDDQFKNGMRYLYESNNPDITVTPEEPAYASVKAGQYVYVFCSYNTYTATSGVEAGAHLEISVGGAVQ